MFTGSSPCVEITTSVDDASRPCQTSLVTTAMCLAYSKGKNCRLQWLPQRYDQNFWLSNDYKFYFHLFVAVSKVVDQEAGLDFVNLSVLIIIALWLSELSLVVLLKPLILLPASGGQAKSEGHTSIHQSARYRWDQV